MDNGIGPIGFNTNPTAGGYGFNPYPSVTGGSAPMSNAPPVGFGTSPTYRPTPVWNDPSTWGFNFPGANTNTQSVGVGTTPTYPPSASWTNPSTWGNGPTGTLWGNSPPPTPAFGTNNAGSNSFGTNAWNNSGFGGANSGWPTNPTTNPLTATADRLRQWLNPMQGSPPPGVTAAWSQQPPQYGSQPPPSGSFGTTPFGGTQPQNPVGAPNAFNTPGGVQYGQPTWRTAPQPTSYRTTNPTTGGGAEPPIVIPPAALAGEIYAPSRRVRQPAVTPSVSQPTAVTTTPPNFNAPPAAYPQQQPAARPQRNWLEMTDLPPVRK